ncbi:MAG: nitroreductase family protein [Chloroflexi bacterium]|nr:nitroreductase family protein [Chloroflexota bacterium]
MNHTVELLRTLRSVRRFGATPIPDEALHDILTAARWTGSAKNVQPWHLIVVRDREMLQLLATCGPFAGHLAGAQAAVVLVMEGLALPGLFDEGRLAQNIMLAGWAHGIGSCIGSIYPADNEAKAKQALNIPQDRGVHTAISLGYPADDAALRVSQSPIAAPIPLGRQALTDLVSWERFGEQR